MSDTDTETGSEFTLERELAEVHLLLDNISSSSSKSLAEIEKEAIEEAGLPADWIKAICEIPWPPERTPRAQQAALAALVIKAKDFLNRQTSPANGRTIAFTLLVTAEDPTAGVPDARRKPMSLWRQRLYQLYRWVLRAPAAPDDGAQPDEKPSRALLSYRAYPGLVPKAVGFRRAMTVMSVFLLVWLVITCAVSWYAAFGNATLAQLATVTAAHEAAEKEVRAVEIGAAGNSGQSTTARPNDLAPAAPKDAAAGGGDTARPVAPACPEPDMTAAVRFSDVREMQACRARDLAAAQVKQVQENLTSWLDCGPIRCRSLGERTWHGLTRLFSWLPGKQVAATATWTAHPVTAPREAYYATILATILATSVLPVLYGFLGAGAAIVRNLSKKMEDSELAPRDLTLSIQRLALGAVVGACISLFVAAPGAKSGVDGDAGLLGTVALSGSALSFVAGFSVEAVFTAMEALIQRVFGGAKETK